MRIIFILLLLLTLSNCTKPKTVLICGDHVCINNDEANQFFEENLSIEVKIINKKDKKEVDLVELNMKNNDDENKKEINIYKKQNTKKKLKVLSNEEIVKIKNDIKTKEKKKRVAKKITDKIENTDKDFKEKNNDLKLKKDTIPSNSVKKKVEDVVDICTIIKKCNIEEISKYLIKQGEKKDFPDITKRQ